MNKKAPGQRPGRQCRWNETKFCVEQKKGDNKTSVKHTIHVYNTTIIITDKNAFVKWKCEKNHILNDFCASLTRMCKDFRGYLQYAVCPAIGALFELSNLLKIIRKILQKGSLQIPRIMVLLMM